MTTREISSLIYQKLSSRVDGLNIDELMSIYGFQERDILLGVNELEKRGLIHKSGQLISIIPWWDEDHLEIFFNISFVEEDVFKEYCSELDMFCNELRSDGFQALRPYAHETVLEIILGAVGTLTLAEFGKTFLSELGKKCAEFVGKTVEKFCDRGVTEVEINGVRRLKNGEIFSFTIKDSNEKKVSKHLAKMLETVERMSNELEKKDEVILKDKHWEVKFKVKRENSKNTIRP